MAMMDLKEIIKWFIPCFHLLEIRKIGYLITILSLFLFLCPTSEAKVLSGNLRTINSNSTSDAKALIKSLNQSEIFEFGNRERSLDAGTGRTFGLRMRKMAQALIPLVFQLGMAATWAVVAALVGIKTLLVTLVILKILLLAGAAKIGALFGAKAHHPPPQAWQPPHQKEIHLHIHNGGHGPHEEHEAYQVPWNRDGISGVQLPAPGIQMPAPFAVPAESRPNHVVLDPYAAGPQTISTPFGHYVKIEPVRNYITSQGNT